MFSIKQHVIDLEKDIALLYEEFIKKFIPANPADTPDQYQHSVKAFCILAHAAFEEFVEKVSVEVMLHAAEKWLSHRQPSEPLLSLVLFYQVSLDVVDDEDEEQDRCFDAMRHAIDQVKQAHSKTVYENQGFSLRYLRKLLIPVAVDVPTDARFGNSLRILADARGSYAHTSARAALFTDQKKASRPMTPETARDVVFDCLELCKRIAGDSEKYLI